MANNLKGWSKATNQFVGVVSHDLPVFTGTWLSFVSIYYKVLGSAWGVRLYDVEFLHLKTVLYLLYLKS